MIYYTIYIRYKTATLYNIFAFMHKRECGTYTENIIIG